MIVDIETRRLRTIGHRPLAVDLRAFLEGNEAVDFQPRDRDEAYGFVRDTLERFGYRRLGKRDKGVVLKFLVAATGLSLKQTERLVRQWRETGEVLDRRGGSRGRPFARRYTPVDIRLLADVDEAYGQMSGLATREVLRRQFEVFGDARFDRLAAISNGHVYNLRGSATYRAKRTVWTKRFADDVNRFAHGVLSPFLNFHRPCLFATEYRDAAGKVRRKYLARDVATPYARFRSLPNAVQHLKPGIDFALLDAAAAAETDLEAARRVQAARRALFLRIAADVAPARAAG